MELRTNATTRRQLSRAALLAGGLAAAFALAGCGSSRHSAPAPSGGPTAATECGTNSGRGCAATRQRVDLATPSLSHPTEITNRLFPISRLRTTVLLGHVGGKPFRTETTLLPGTRTVTWRGRRVRVLLSQYLAYLDGRITEVALDRYAQTDDGSVWYLGEDVFDYENGTVSATEGTWLAGREGPAAMIMPAHPKVGDVYRPENAPGIVFEEVNVKSVGTTVDGPRGPVHGAIVAHELHSDGTTEDKVFAPGYGEFRTAGGGDLEALALAVPTDAVAAPVPRALHKLTIGAMALLESARIQDWEKAAATHRHLAAAAKNVLAGGTPPLIAARLQSTLGSLAKAMKSHKAPRVTQAAIDVWQSALDLELRYRPVAEINQRRFELWTQQLRVHAAAKDLGGATGDVAVLEWIRDRFAETLDPAQRRELDLRLGGLRAAADARNLAAAADHAARLASLLRA
jgi:hypothetical protein